MAASDAVGVYEIEVPGCVSTDAALALQEPIARLLCPDERHAGPCEVPWSFTLRSTEDSEHESDEPSADLVLAVHTARRKAEEVAGRVRTIPAVVGPVVVRDGDTEQFEHLVRQYQIENEA